MAQKDTISVHMVREALRQSGVDAVAILQEVGLEPALLHANDARVPVLLYSRLWRLIARRTDDEFFGMDPRPLRSGSLAFLCRCAMAQPTVATALDAALGFLSLMLEDLPAHLLRQQSLAEIVIDDSALPPRRAFTYFTYWMILHGVACWLAGRRIPILAVELRGPAPDYCDDYRVMFSHNLRFDRPRTRIIFAADCLDLPVRRTPQELQRFLNRAPANILVKYRDPDSLARRIRQHLRQLRPHDWPEAEDMARHWHLSTATLRRRLAEEGQTWQQIKDSVRRELAIVWLADAQLSFETIAAQLGFADASSFYKAFRKWSGASPGHYRQLILGGTGQTAQPG
ncbi:AraC family transcriptional regulator [Pseudomonas sp. M47T1]|uniref:AraC family transcriptional regulator n=1 Tax=Pseudomonas sp. M47T1 TaxID=1179778 RepID=UPI0005BB1E8A|nr:AraC family transcriptional regulator [Pseudomonas sp. M47T1]